MIWRVYQNLIIYQNTEKGMMKDNIQFQKKSPVIQSSEPKGVCSVQPCFLFLCESVHLNWLRLKFMNSRSDFEFSDGGQGVLKMDGFA